MMQQYDFRRGGKKCSVSDEPLKPGDFYISALIELPDGQMSRVDFSEDNWDPDSECVGSWRQQIPDLDTGQIYWAPPSVQLAYFKHQLEKKNLDLAFVMSLLLVQKRILYIKDHVDTDEGLVSILLDRRSNEVFEVPERVIDQGRIMLIQNELAEHLFSNQPILSEDESSS